MIRVLLIGAALALPAVGAAGESFTLPEGCQASLTAQLRSCLVLHLYRCEGAPAGERWMVIKGPGDRLPRHTRYTRDGQWLGFHVEGSADRARLDGPPADPISVAALASSGRDAASYTLQRLRGSEVVASRREEFVHRLTGEVQVVDGVPLEQVAVEVTSIDRASGQVVARQSGFDRLDRERGLIFVSVRRDEGAARARDTTPVEFTWPGEPGFLTAEPIHDCATHVSMS